MAFVASCVLVIAVADSAASTNWSGASGASGCTGVNMQMDATVGIYYSGLTMNMTLAVDAARTYVIDPTDINSCQVTGTYDVAVMDSTWDGLCGYTWWTATNGGGTLGLATCDVVASNQRCSRHSVYFQEPWTNGTSAENRRDLAAHEIGHTLGLKHRTSGSVMVQGYPKAVRVFDAHDTGHINGAC
jgi:hypothetical protein